MQMSELVVVTGLGQGPREARRAAKEIGKALNIESVRGYAHDEATLGNKKFVVAAEQARIGVGFSRGNLVLSGFLFEDMYYGAGIPRPRSIIGAGLGVVLTMAEQARPSRAAARNPMNAVRAGADFVGQLAWSGMARNMHYAKSALQFDGEAMLADRVRQGAGAVHAIEFTDEHLFVHALNVPDGAEVSYHEGTHVRFPLEPGIVMREVVEFYETRDAA